MPRDNIKNTRQPDDDRNIGVEGKKCAAVTHSGAPCQRWASHGSEYCSAHLASMACNEPSQLPGITRSQLAEQKRNLAARIASRRAAKVRQATDKQAADERQAQQLADQVVTEAAKLIDPTLQITTPTEEPGTKVRLRSLDDCLELIELAIEEIEDLPASLNKTKTLIQAARTAGGLILKAGIANKAIDWFAENVKLVADIDLDEV